VITTSAVGRVHVFSAEGAKLKDLTPGFYASMVRLARLGGAQAAATILVGGTGGSRVPLAALDYEGKRRWSIDLPVLETNFIDSAQPAPGRPWLAVGLRGGLVHVVDLDRGEIIAHTPGQGTRPEVGWLAAEGAGPPLLLVATGDALNAFRLTGE
jgi:hypothetical protein